MRVDDVNLQTAEQYREPNRRGKSLPSLEHKAEWSRPRRGRGLGCQGSGEPRDVQGVEPVREAPLGCADDRAYIVAAIPEAGGDLDEPVRPFRRRNDLGNPKAAPLTACARAVCQGRQRGNDKAAFSRADPA